ncbi:MAG: NUDIX domain-containing protein [Nanoarchaeota archaeon]|nr:NUDIX domain-containing protein [Nanoarchaeota archaeon]
MEFLDIINDKDDVIGKAEYSEIYKNKLPHRIAHVLIFNKKREMALQIRSKNKSFCPGFFSTSAGGHVQSGESHEEGALRELKEELGIVLPLTLIAKSEYLGKEQINKFLSIYEAEHEGPFNFNKLEVENMEFIPLKEINLLLKTSDKFHPELRFILEKYYK